ncbi:CHASE4 domain-containing protein [Maridesulfovibrio sp.]|uniref:sensor histidine kinase n=1 Tax=Maridesulfovibrio sp. TaxID=2795000 RepID=UPI0039EE1659
MRIGLKGKSYLIVIVLCLFIFLGSGLLAFELNRKAVVEVEKVIAEENIKRAEYAIRASSEALQSLCRDWAWWDDSYKFVQEFDEGFIESNLSSDILINLDLDILLFFDEQNEFYYFLSADGTEQIEKCFVDNECIGTKIVRQCNADGLTGLVRINHRLMQVSVQKIMDSAIEGVPKGTLVMGRFFGDRQLDRLGQSLQMDLSFKDLDTSLQKVVFFLEPKDGEHAFHSLMVQNDVFGDPLVLLQLSMPQDSYGFGNSLFKSYIFFMGGALCFLGIGTVLVLNYYFVSRVKVLRAQLRGKFFAGPGKHKVCMSGNDELSDLAESVNEILVLLQEQRVKAEAASKVKSEFLANMSHEIRTPMHSILGMVELLNEMDMNAEQREYLNIVGAAGENLLDVINDVLEISKIEAGHLQIEQHEFLLREMIERIVNVFAIEASRKNLKVICTIANDVPDKVVGDPTRIRQVLNNLISNAVKFTSKGRIVVSVSLEGGRVLFEVEDEGIGIAEDKIEIIFESFAQADSSTSRKYGGTGLGLPISRKLVEMMGGEISVSSGLGVGTVFRFDLDLIPD